MADQCGYTNMGVRCEEPAGHAGPHKALIETVLRTMRPKVIRCRAERDGFQCQGDEDHVGAHRYDAAGISMAWGR